MTRQNPSAARIVDTATSLQLRATTPDATVWVGASAGSGKTKVLAERLLRLMLPDKKGDRPASDPGRILCITFTKAAASEVMDRIMRYLRAWAIATPEALSDDLEKLLDAAPDTAQMERARALFAVVLETPGGMKINTIHAFCQSVLARFPMEANLPAGFEVMAEGEARSVMTAVRRALITRLQDPGASHTPLHAAFAHLATLKKADEIENLLEKLASERVRLAAMRTYHGGIEGLCRAVFEALGVSAGETPDSHTDAYMAATPETDLRAAIPRLMADKGKSNNAYADTIADTLIASDRSGFADSYAHIFITQETTPRKPTGIVKNDAGLSALFEREAGRAAAYINRMCAIQTARATVALLRVADAALEAYETEKRERNRLDYEDLIERTRALLGAGGVHWVHYKLDSGIDHILVDEAQDTNPDQWDIVAALYDEFYDGTGQRGDLVRTTFVVGDEKQSIFSFQRADPRVFDAMRTRLGEKAETAQKRFLDIPMQTSFRSSPSVLKMVDAVFLPPEMREGVARSADGSIHHTAHLSGKGGMVELWPLLERTKDPEDEAKKPETGKKAVLDWDTPAIREDADDPVTAMAEKVAAEIERLLNDPSEKLASRGDRIRAGDIMILLSKRKPLAEPILKALRMRGIPVGGIDRMVVMRQLGVMDVMAAIAFTLLPEDDLNLANLLKSPLCGLDEGALFTLSVNRGGTPLWQRLRESAAHQAVTAWLSDLVTVSGAGSVSSLLHRILYGPCPADAQSGVRAIMSRLGADMRDPLQELLARADAHDLRETTGIQGFVQEMSNDTAELKRQMAEDGDRVRVMTVHGSKGLEAPIVFMPDTVRSTNGGSKTEPILWPARDDEAGVPLWPPVSDLRTNDCKTRIEEAKTRADEEYRRLLYVALTRAADRLYIGGAKAIMNMDAKSWYPRIAAAFESGALGNVVTDETGVRRISNPQTDPLRPAKHAAGMAIGTDEMPAWAKNQAPVPENPPRPLMPSKQATEEPAALSPLFGDISYRFRRGRLIHTLFQFLPDLPVTQREERAKAWLSMPAHDLDNAAQMEILSSVMAVLADSAFAPLFGPDARAEVPLTGLLGPQSIVSGQIDRLLVTDKTVMVVDYKTNRPAPKDVADVPEAYRRQMRTYRDLLRAIWPEHEVRCALLWTDGPRLMDITDTL